MKRYKPGDKVRARTEHAGVPKGAAGQVTEARTGTYYGIDWGTNAPASYSPAEYVNDDQVNDGDGDDADGTAGAPAETSAWQRLMAMVVGPA